MNYKDEIEMNLHGCEFECIANDTYRYNFDSMENHSCYVTIKKIPYIIGIMKDLTM